MCSLRPTALDGAPLCDLRANLQADEVDDSVWAAVVPKSICDCRETGAAGNESKSMVFRSEAWTPCTEGPSTAGGSIPMGASMPECSDQSFGTHEEGSKGHCSTTHGGEDMGQAMFSGYAETERQGSEAIEIALEAKGGDSSGEPEKAEILCHEITAAFLLKLIEKQGYRCALSGRQLTPENSTLDHIVSCAEGGSHSQGNVWWVHSDVNAAKGTMATDTFIQMCRDVAGHAAPEPPPV
jgi:hypothetical protein